MKFKAPECIICFGELAENLSTTTCGHVFHSACIKKCQDQRIFNCPFCRANFGLIPLRNLTLSIQDSQSSSESSDPLNNANQFSKKVDSELIIYISNLNKEIENLKKENLELTKKNHSEAIAKETQIKDAKKTIDALLNNVKNLQNKIENIHQFHKSDLRAFQFVKERLQESLDKGKEYEVLLNNCEGENIRLNKESQELKEKLKKACVKNSELIKENKRLFLITEGSHDQKDLKKNYSQADRIKVEKEIKSNRSKKL